MKKKIKIGYTDVDIQIIDKKLFPKWSSEQQRTLKQEHLKLFEGSGTRDLGTWSPVFELPLPVPASRSDFPFPVSRLPFVEVFDYIKHNY
jgi:hypothetical protein